MMDAERRVPGRFQPRSGLSRRELLALAAGAGGAWFAPEVLWADDLDPRVSGIVAKSIAVDMHSHIPMTFVRDGEAAGKGAAASSPGDDAAALVDAMKRTGLAALCHTYAVDHLANAKPGEYYQYHQQALGQEDRLLAQHGIGRALNLNDLRAAHGMGQAALIRTCEGAQFLEGRLDRVEEAYRRGLRVMQLVHHDNDMVAPLGDIQTRPANEFGGLTPFGARVVKECNRLRILMDLAHAGFPMVKGVLNVTTEPIAITHTALDTPLGRTGQSAGMLQRLVSRDHARAVAEAGGIVGVWKSFATLKDFVAGLKEMADVVGIDHVGIGTDTYISAPASQAGGRNATNDLWREQPGGFVFKIANEMLRQGFTPAEIGGVVGDNFCRVFGHVMEGRA